MQHRELKELCKKSHGIRRGSGRPRKDAPYKKSLDKKLRRWKSNSSFPRDPCSSAGLSPRKDSASDGSSGNNTVAKLMMDDDPCMMDDVDMPDTSGIVALLKTDKMSAPEDPPLFQEQWPGYSLP